MCKKRCCLWFAVCCVCPASTPFPRISWILTNIVWTITLCSILELLLHYCLKRCCIYVNVLADIRFKCQHNNVTPTFRVLMRKTRVLTKTYSVNVKEGIWVFWDRGKKMGESFWVQLSVRIMRFKSVNVKKNTEGGFVNRSILATRQGTLAFLLFYIPSNEKYLKKWSFVILHKDTADNIFLLCEGTVLFVVHTLYPQVGTVRPAGICFR